LSEYNLNSFEYIALQYKCVDVGVDLASSVTVFASGFQAAFAAGAQAAMLEQKRQLEARLGRLPDAERPPPLVGVPLGLSLFSLTLITLGSPVYISRLFEPRQHHMY
jgi:hypothetical protein